MNWIVPLVGPSFIYANKWIGKGRRYWWGNGKESGPEANLNESGWGFETGLSWLHAGILKSICPPPFFTPPTRER